MISDCMSVSRTRLAGVTAALCVCALPLSANALTFSVDDFSNNQGPIAASNGTPTVTDTIAASGATGGFRELTVQSTSGDVSAFVNGGALTYNGTNGSSGLVTALYNANGAGLGGGAGVDVSNGGSNDQFTAVLISLDIPSLLRITVTDTDSSDTVQVTLPGLTTTATDFDFAFSDFSMIDFTAITAIEITFEDNTDVLGANGSFDFLGATSSVPPEEVPLPASVLLMLSALGGLGYVGSRRRNA